MADEHGHAEAYVEELQALDSWAQTQFASIPAAKRKVITSHYAFGYFGAHYADALSAADQPGATYLRMARYNVTHLVAGMRLN